MTEAHPTRDDWAETFAKARDTDLEAVAGVKLYRSGRRMRGECPVCHASKGKKADGAFSVDPQAGFWKCWGCGAGGDVIDLEQAIRGGSVREAAVRLAGAPRVSVSAGRAAEAPSTASRSAAPAPSPPGSPPAPTPNRGGLGGARVVSGAERMAGRLWDEAHPTIGGTPAQTYLRLRGIPQRFVASASPWLRYHPAATWGKDEVRGDWITAPAMIAQVRTPSGRTGGVHVTYLRPDGRAKAQLDPAKRMWGPMKDLDGRPGGVWFGNPAGDGPLVVGEGIESTLAAMALLGRPCRGVAALSLGALQGGWLLDKWGRLDPSAVSADPEKPAFTWPGQGEVLVAVDRDMSGIEVKVRKLGGGTVRRRLEAEDRARICAGLAVQAWKAAGAKAVRAIAPGAGRDFNDELRARLAAGEGVGV